MHKTGDAVPMHDVSVVIPCFRCGSTVGRADAEGDQQPLPGQARRGGDRLAERGRIADGVVRGQHEKQALWVLRARVECGDGGGRRGVAARGLEDLHRRPHAELVQLLGDNEAMLVVADDDWGRALRQAGKARHRLLQQRALRDERQELLGEGAARHRPQARPGAARQNHRVNSFCHALFYGREHA